MPGDRRPLVQEWRDLLPLRRHLHGCQWRRRRRFQRLAAATGLSARARHHRDLADAVSAFAQQGRRYDISNYYGVDPRYGTLGDFVEFTHGCQQRGIRVIIDLVVNHTSDQHDWFRSARSSKDSPYRDWYVWSDKKPANANTGMVFPGVQKSTWTRDKQAGAWYFHRFYDFQPDLNTSNPHVQAETSRSWGSGFSSASRASAWTPCRS
nr:alpha-amylase family glycosyl hydrolase [Bradyrhizobium sp. BR2003]